MTSIRRVVCDLGLDLPEPTGPAGHYRPWVRSGSFVHLSGQVCKRGGDAAFIGKVGREFSIEEGCEAARLSAIQLIAQMIDAVDDELEAIRQVCRIGGFVNAVESFDGHSKIIDAASELIVDVFGDAGQHARSAVGVGSLPRGVAVEIEAMIELRD